MPATTGTDSVAMIGAGLLLAASILLIAVAWGMAQFFDHMLDDLHTRNQRTYIAVCWGWMLALMVRRVQSVNIALFAFTIGAPPVYTKFITLNLPANWSILITFVGWLYVVALLSLTVPFIRAK